MSAKISVYLSRGLIRALSAAMLVLSLNSPASGSSVITGVYGLWAVDNLEASLKELSQNNFKVVSGLEGIGMLDVSHKYGMRCLVGFKSGLTKDVTEDADRWNKYLVELRDYVSSLKDHPAVYAWYLVDEPDLKGIAVDKIKTLVATVRSIDKKHPLYTVLYVEKPAYRKYIQFFDIIGIEPYLPAKSANVNIVKTEISSINRDFKMLKLNRKLFVVLGAFDLRPRDGQANSTLRKPTVEEFKQMINICSIAKVDGVFAWTLAFKNDPKYYDWSLPKDAPDLWNAVKQMPSDLP